MATVTSDAELIQVLTAEIEKCFQSVAKSLESAPEADTLESYGSTFFDQLRPRIRELFGRALNLPSRTA